MINLTCNRKLLTFLRVIVSFLRSYLKRNFLTLKNNKFDLLSHLTCNRKLLTFLRGPVTGEVSF